ncbi:aspartyl-phosphate phosphatase Spo0E family protein [Desulfosporosinus fructosivorans]
MQTDLLHEIDNLRRRLISFVSAKSFVSPEVVKLSQKLDCLIVQYYSIVIVQVKK